MIDREARDELVDVIERYLADEITAFDFDEALGEFMGPRDDRTVRDVARDLWFYYDDVIDHEVVADKELWDFFQRILLLLKSDGELECSRRWRWTLRQAIALPALAAFVTVAALGGCTPIAVLMWIGIGCLAAGLARWRERDERSKYREAYLAAPFSSVSELLGVRRGVSGFRKTKYPEHVRDRRKRPELSEMAGLWAASLVLAPLALLVIAIPEADTHCRVVT